MGAKRDEAGKTRIALARALGEAGYDVDPQHIRLLACEAAGLEVCGSPAFCHAVGVSLRTPPVVTWDLPAENRPGR